MSSGLTPRTVRCPACKGDSLYGAANPYRPFCCERCKNWDFGAWANEEFKVAAEVPQEENTSPTPGLQ